MGRSEPLAPLGAASLQDQSSILSCHSCAEAVRFCAAPVVRLEGPLGHKLTILPSNETIRLNACLAGVKKRRAIWGRFEIVAASIPRRDSTVRRLSDYSKPSGPQVTRTVIRVEEIHHSSGEIF